MHFETSLFGVTQSGMHVAGLQCYSHATLSIILGYLVLKINLWVLLSSKVSQLQKYICS